MERFLGELLLRGAVVWLLTGAVLWLLRNSTAAHRHLVCVLALTGLGALPAAPPLVPALALLPAPRPAHRSLITTPPPSLPVAQTPSPSDRPAPSPGQSSPGPDERLDAVPPVDASAPRRPLPLDPALLLGAVWALGTAVLLLRLAVALARLRRLTGGSGSASVDGVSVRVSDRVRSPLTWGVRRSVILLPAGLLSEEEGACVSAVRHEQAHIARWDWIWNLGAELVCAGQWFQPGAWWLRSRMRAESERACDDSVLLSGVAGPDYASHLLRVLQSTSAGELAPAMARSRGMEERMRHILDDHRTRRTPVRRLTLTIPVMLAVVTLAALRITARPAAARALVEPLSAPVLSLTSPVVSPPAFLSAPPAVATPAPATSPLPATVLAAPAGEPVAAERAAPPATERNEGRGSSEIVWGKAVDNWEPGFQLLAPANARKHGLPLNCRVEYRVLVRNRAKRERMLEVHCDRNSAYLIPGREQPEGLRTGQLPDQFRAQGVTDLALAPAAFDLKVGPGEAIVVPVELGLTIGSSDPPTFPRVTSPNRGDSWLIHTVEIRALTPDEESLAERALSTPYSEKRPVTTFDRNGKTGQKNAFLRGAGKATNQLFAGTRIELGSAQAEEAAGPVPIAWGKVDQGLQCGLRLLHPKPAFATGDSLEAEVYYKNASSKPIFGAMPRQTDLYPIIRDTTGREILVDQGARVDLLPIWQEFPAGEIRKLGVARIDLVPEHMPETPESQLTPHVALKPGEYLMSAYGGVSAPNGGAPESGRVPFRVARADKAATEPAEGVAWSEEWHGLRLGLRLPRGVTRFPKLSQARFEVLLQNRSDRKQDCRWLGYPTMNQFEPELFTQQGKRIRYVHTLAGPYMGQETSLAAGETAVLGSISLPREEAEVLDKFRAGSYRAEFSLELKLTDKQAKSLQARIPFQVAAK